MAIEVISLAIVEGFDNDDLATGITTLKDDGSLERYGDLKGQ
ncbi:hypothetical protein SLEP1_g34667 [Rubroshorea leprosula]|uniref:Uncharacterized protein n=1 Tax=Rubroshorea leprosula TaxID=152421 RepID=A0AAV5KKQ4_9ROSI|nr:hypothetical protein SLEP1_g34667 [Rubroshorea leprosula]